MNRLGSHSPRNSKKCLYGAIALLVAVNVGIVAGCIVLKRYRFDSVVERDFTLYVGREYTADSVFRQMEGTVASAKINRLRRLTRTKGFPETLRTGAYLITPEMSLVDVYDLLTTGNPVPVLVTFNNLRTVEDFAESWRGSSCPKKRSFLRC